jgi:hypothetical protein
MLRTATAMAILVSGLAITTGPSSAQTVAPAREARLEIAKQHMKLVCQLLEAQRSYGRAFRCYSNVTAFLSDPKIVEISGARPVRVASARFDLAAPLAPARSIRPVRSASSLLASNHILLGVGF